MVSFIKAHLLNKIGIYTNEKYNKSKHNGFIFFDEPIKDGKYLIDRVNKLSPFSKDEILPISWYLLKGSTILEIYKRLRDNKVYIPVNINGIRYKDRIYDR